MDYKQVHLFISGYVQGVGFRQFIRNYAQQLHIYGWIKNIPDGRVEAIFMGEDENVKTMIEVCKKGAPLAEVRHVEIHKERVDLRLNHFVIE